MNKSILIIDDNLTICLMLKSWLIKKGFNVETTTSVSKAKEIVREQPFDLIISDIRMPDADGFDFLNWIKRYDSGILVIMMTDYADIESAVASMKSGAVDYISKPIDPDIFSQKIEEALQTQHNIQVNNRFSHDFIVPHGEEYKQLFNKLDQVAEKKSHLFIHGDRGTGKASAVKYIYEKGIHRSKPLIKIDANELGNSGFHAYGAEKGDSLKEKFMTAKGGQFYITEIDQLNKLQQGELLSIVSKQKRDDSFIQVALSSDKSNKELQQVIIPKLYKIMGKSTITLPSLKGRVGEIEFFTSYFLKFANHILDKEVEGVDDALQQIFNDYDWPGNLQELKNCVLKATLLTDSKIIKCDIASTLFGNKKELHEKHKLSKYNVQSLRKENYEKEKICQALEIAKGNKTMAASILNIDRKTLYNKIKLYDVVLSN